MGLSARVAERSCVPYRSLALRCDPAILSLERKYEGASFFRRPHSLLHSSMKSSDQSNMTRSCVLANDVARVTIRSSSKNDSDCITTFYSAPFPTSTQRSDNILLRSTDSQGIYGRGSWAPRESLRHVILVCIGTEHPRRCLNQVFHRRGNTPSSKRFR